MNCQNTKNSITVKNVDLLSEQEESELNNHLKDCPPCQSHSALLNEAYQVLERSDKEPSSLGAIWEGIQTDIKNGEKYPPLFAEKPAGNNLVIALSCSYCHGPLPRTEACYCASCLSPHHDDCFKTHGRCTSMGCEETHTVKPQLNQAPKPKVARKRSYVGLIGLAIGAPILAVGLTAGFGINRYQAAKEEALRAQALEQEQAALRHAQEKKQAEAATAAEIAKSKSTKIKGLARKWPKKISQTPVRAQRKIDIEVLDMDLNEAVQLIADKVNCNILVEPGINEKITIKLREIPWKQALNLIAKMTGCEIEEPSPNVLMLTQPPKVTIQFNQANVKTVLQLLAAYSGKNIIIDENVVGKVTTDFKETRWDIALEALVRVNKLYAQQNKEIIIVSKTPFKKRWGTELGEKQSQTEGKKISFNKTAVVSDFAKELSQVSDKPIVVKDGEKEVLTVKFSEVPWNNALKLIARQSQREIIETQKQYILLPIKNNFFIAQNAPSSVWIQALGQMAEKNIVTQSELSSTVSLDFNKVSAQAALEATAHSLGYKLEEKSGVLTMHSPSRKVGPDSKKQGQATEVTVGPRTFSLKLQATLGNQSKRYAIISGRCYRQAETLLDENDEEIPLRVAGINDRIVKIHVYDKGSDKASRTLELEFPRD